MCDMCDGATRTEYVRDFRRKMEEYGWALQYVESTVGEAGIEPAFCYTVGLTDFGHPEIIMTGRGPTEAAATLNALATIVTTGGSTLEAGTRCTAGSFDVFIVNALYPHEWMFMNNRMFGAGRFAAVQAVWEDDRGHLPWEGAIPSTIVQPMLGPPPHWS